MKFLSGLIIGVLLCAAIFAVGGYYVFNGMKDFQPANTPQVSQALEEDDSSARLNAALNAFNKASSPEDMLASLDKIIALRPGEPEAYSAKAAVLMQKGDYRAALENYNKALSLNPDSAELYMGRASALLMLGDYAGANKDLSSAIAINPALAEAYYNRGVSNVNLARFNPAMSDFAQAGKLFSASGNRAGYMQSSQAFNLLKKQSAGIKKNKSASKAVAAKAAAELKPSVSPADAASAAKFKSEIVRSLGGLSSSLKNGDKKAMLQKFKQASAGLTSGEVNTGDFNAFAAAASQKASGKASSAKKNLLDYTSDAKAKMAKGDYAGAAADLDKAIELSSNPSDLYAQRAAANLQNKNYKAAFEDYSKAIEADKNNAAAYLNRARLRASMGDNKGAAQDAAAAKALYQEQGNKEGATQAQNMANLASGKGLQERSVRDGVAEALFKDASNAYASGNYQESLDKFNELAQRQPDVPEVYYNRAIANAALGDKDAALRDYRRTIAMNPNLPDAHIGAASILMEQGKNGEAQKEISAALSLNPNLPAAYKMRGTQSLQSGNPSKAVADFTKAIELDGNDGASYFSRGLGYAQQGDFNNAREDFANANSLAAEQGNQPLLDEIVKYQNMLEEAAKQQK